MSKKYLLDTCILVHLLRNRYGVAERIARIGWDKCSISEMTVIELLYGAEVSCTAIATNNILVTENVNHLSRIEGITLENWIER